MGASERHIEPKQPKMGKAHTQQMVSQPSQWRIWTKRRVHRTMGFAKTTTRYALVLGLCLTRS